MSIEIKTKYQYALAALGILSVYAISHFSKPTTADHDTLATTSITQPQSRVSFPFNTNPPPQIETETLIEQYCQEKTPMLRLTTRPKRELVGSPPYYVNYALIATNLFNDKRLFRELKPQYTLESPLIPGQNYIYSLEFDLQQAGVQDYNDGTPLPTRSAGGKIYFTPSYTTSRTDSPQPLSDKYYEVTIQPC